MVHSSLKKIRLVFYRTTNQRLPVRDWLLGLSRSDRKLIGIDLAIVEYGWPIGMPICKPLGSGLWEVRTDLSDRKIARVLFCTHDEFLLALHGFVKKNRKTPRSDLDLARRRMRELRK